MGKRILAGVLWFFAGWYLGSFIAFLIGQPDLLGPILGIAAAFVFAVDPKGYIWKKPEAETETVTATELSPAFAEPAS